MIAYLGSAFERKEELKGYAKILEELGWELTSSWLDDVTMIDKGVIEAEPEWGRRFAMRDLHDLGKSRLLIVFTGSAGRGGHQVEMGFALATGIRVVVVGPNVNLFCLLADKHYGGWEEFLAGELGIEGEKEEDES
jgi:hypothetical protein